MVGRKLYSPLYREDVVSFDAYEVYNQGDATGFIRLNALRLKVAAQVHDK